METKEKVKIKISQPFTLHTESVGAKINFIEFTDELLRIDFEVKPDLKRFVSGWWVQIHSDTFIRPVGSRMKLMMVNAQGISIAPVKTYLPHRNSRLSFSLYFPLPPDGTKFIDIIEKEGGDNTYYNFYGVAMSKILMERIFIGDGSISQN